MSDLGTIDLGDFCGCPDPCADCCLCGCKKTDLPSVLLVTFHDMNGGCGTLDGKTALMTYDGTVDWISNPSPVPPAPFSMTCRGDGSWEFHVGGSVTNSPKFADPGYSCSPPMFRFSGFQGGPCTFDVTVTLP